jgi:polyphosphate kinase
VTPVTAATCKERLWEVLDISLRDQRQAWILNSDGTYSQLRPSDAAEGPEAMGTHAALMKLYAGLAAG